jgi:hypothetical protein
VSNEPEEFIRRHRSTGVLVDSQLMLLWLVGRKWPARIGTFKRTQAYDLQAFLILEAFLSQFSRIVTTPNVMTEVSNLAGALDQGSRHEIFTYWRDVAGATLSDERYIESGAARQAPSFPRLGITDAAIEVLAGGGTGILTDDLPLYVQLSEQGRHVLNFTHLRALAWEPN